MVREMTADELSQCALQAGLTLPEEELQRLLPGVNRSRTQVGELRDLITDNVEPASAFSAQKEQAR